MLNELSYICFLLLNTLMEVAFLQFKPEKFVETMKLMEHHYGANDYVTSKDSSLLSPGTYYLTEVDTKYRRFYDKKEGENASHRENGLVANGH